eukprot:CAMPEP_0117042304 /NCGR_PEP_ID=MMETSP0472-20121206/29471_1 /TAXON_ID=693140 ORGANISM="Tiarina fusus, Strain LIS" /NCGR_SAMPLE_ID=MMETSP0472 /ASSEMBLY_ACC=CAM_ASM_000603 /LENGTH=199 /DNA_ID=CAMNT_0004753513 /DNA_START=50 /DNA_END=649 /DNA_ORIENTATION=+
MLSHSEEEECLNHQGAIDAIYKGNTSHGTNKTRTGTRKAQERFRDMTTASIVTLVSALASQHKAESSPSLKPLGGTNCTHPRTICHRLGGKDSLVGPRRVADSTVSPTNRLDLLASTADAMKEFQTLRGLCVVKKRSTSNVKHTIGGPGRIQRRPSPIGPPPRLPRLKPWQTVKKPTRGIQIANLKLQPKNVVAIVEPE